MGEPPWNRAIHPHGVPAKAATLWSRDPRVAARIGSGHMMRPWWASSRARSARTSARRADPAVLFSCGEVARSFRLAQRRRARRNAQDGTRCVALLAVRSDAHSDAFAPRPPRRTAKRHTDGSWESSDASVSRSRSAACVPRQGVDGSDTTCEAEGEGHTSARRPTCRQILGVVVESPRVVGRAVEGDGWQPLLASRIPMCGTACLGTWLCAWRDRATVGRVTVPRPVPHPALRPAAALP